MADEKKKSAWDWLIPALAVGAGAASNNYQGAGNFLRGFTSGKNMRREQEQAEKERQQQLEYQKWLQDMQKQEQARKDQAYKDSRMQLTEDLYNQLGGSPYQTAFAPTTTTEQYSTAPQEVQNYVSQYTTQMKPDATRTIKNYGEVSKEEYMNALADAEKRKKEAANNLTWTPELWSAVENSPLAVMYAPQTEVTAVNPNMPSQADLDSMPENVRNSVMQTSTGTRQQTNWQNPTITKDEYMKLLGSVPQGLTSEELAKLKLIEAQTNAANANAWRDRNYFPGSGSSEDESYTSKLLKNYKAESPKIDTGLTYPNQTPIFKNEPLQSYASRTGGSQGERQYLYEQSGNQEYLDPNRSIFGVQNKQDPEIDKYVKSSGLGSIEATVRKAITERKPSAFINKLIQRAALSGYPTDPAVWQQAVLNNTRVTKKKAAK